MPLLVGAAVILASSVLASSAAIASIAPLGAVNEAPLAYGFGLLTVVGVVVVHVVENAERAAALGYSV
mgnify:CR=1 FL=1